MRHHTLILRSLPALLPFLAALLVLPLQGQPAGEIDICGGESPRGAGWPFGLPGLVDRNNMPWLAGDHLVKHQTRRPHTPQSDDGCSPFRVDFEDVILGTGVGFDDPTPIQHPVLGNTTEGELRRRTVCEVLAYISGVIVVQGNPDIVIRTSQTDGGGFLAAAGPFFRSVNRGFAGGTLFDHITTGTDPTPAPGDYDATIIVDFGYPYHTDWSTDPGRGIDLFSVMLHEVTHALGFLSLTAPDGSSRIGGGYSLFDRFLYGTDAVRLIDQSTLAFQGGATTLVSNEVYYQGDRCTQTSPVYSPDPYRQGSSTSHFDSYRSGIRYVMRPSTGGGPDREYTVDELTVLCEMGYELKDGNCNTCAPQGVDDFASTRPGLEVCVAVLDNDINPDGGALLIDPASVVIENGGGTFRIVGDELCFTPATTFSGLAVITYAPSNGSRTGSEARVYVNVFRPSSPPHRQREYLNWYFGRNAGVTFVNGGPEPLTDGALVTHEGTAAVSDPITGEILFYTNGESVWDRTHREMPGGTGLHGDFSSTQSATIVPEPCEPTCEGVRCSTGRYYIFTTHTPDSLNPDGTARFFGARYSIVDMAANGGKGDVVEKNVPLLENGTEKLVVARHPNGVDYWVVTHELETDAFYSFPVTPSGIGTPVISNVGTVYRSAPDPALGYFARPGVGYLKISPDGTKAAVCNPFIFDGNDYWESNVELFDFDNTTGRLSNAVELVRGRTTIFYGLTFSPGSNLLYCATDKVSTNMLQWDVSRSTPAEIAGSLTPIPLSRPVRIGGILIGPDNRIYFSVAEESFLGIIEKPDVPGPGCSIVIEGIHLDGKIATWGLPNNIDADPVGRDDSTNIDSVGLHLTKRIENRRVDYGDTVIYTIRLCNLTECDVTDAVIEDVLPDGLEYVDGFDDYPRQSIPVLASGQCVEVTLRAVAGPTIPLERPVTNCVDLLTSSLDPVRPHLDSNCATFIIGGTDIGVEKSVERDTVRPGDPILYAVTVTNYGPKSGQGVLVRDLLPTGLIYRRHVVSDPTATYDPLSGMLEIPTLPVGERVELRLECEVATDAKDRLTNCAELVDVAPGDLDVTNNRSCVPIYVLPLDLVLSKSVSNDRPLYGSEITWTITVANVTGEPMRDVVVEELIPEGMVYLSHRISAPDATYDTATGLLTIPEIPTNGQVLFTLTCRLDDEGSSEVITNCVRGVQIDTVDVRGWRPDACAEIRPRWCPEPDRLLRIELSDRMPAPLDGPFIAPVRLLDPLEGDPVPRFRILLEFDPELLVLENGRNAALLLEGTILEGWRLVSAQLAAGRYEAEFAPPSGIVSIEGVGELLRPRFRMFIGEVPTAGITASVLVPANRCLAFTTDSGTAVLDSVCGMSYRLIELSGLKYALEPPSPNPILGNASVGFTIGRDGDTRLDLYTVAGEPVATLVDTYLPAGRYLVEWSTAEVPAGLYIGTISSGGWSESWEMILLK